MNDHITKYLKEIGKRGGEQTKQRGSEHYQAIGRAGAPKRWGTGESSNNRFKVTTRSRCVRRHAAPNVARRDKRAARVRAVTSAMVEAAALTISEHS